jgi:hypothetical protein
MAGEKRGKALEAIVSHALKHKRVSACYDISTMMWDEEHDAMRWNPDFFIESRAGSGRPSLLVFVTYAGSETDSRQKFWRNLAEFFEARTQNSNMVTVSVVGGARFRAKLFQTQCLLVDSVVDLQALISNADLRGVLDYLGKYTDKDDLKNRLDTLFRDNAKFRSLVEEIANKIPLGVSSAELNESFWLVPRSGGSAQSLETTHYRRGVAKAALLDSDDREAIRNGRRVAERNEHLALIKYGSLTKSIGGLSLADEEIRFALQHLSEDRLANILSRGITASGLDSIGILRDVPNIREGIVACASNWDRVCSSEALYEELSGGGEIPLTSAQVFRSLKALLAFKLGRQGQEWIEDVVDETSEMRSILVGLIFPKFERNEAKPKPPVVRAIASSLAARCSRISAPSTTEIEQVIGDLIRKEIEAKLVCHGIDPVRELICIAAEDSGVPYESGYLRSGLSETLGFSRKDLGTAGLYLGHDRQAFVHWKTVGSQGRDHKVKELFARGYQSRAEYSEGSYVLRNSPSQVVLVCDGDWRTGDPQFLASGGWTHVIGVDGIQHLVSSLA